MSPRSLRNTIDDIVHIVEDFDIVCFTETHLDQRVPNTNLVIPGFNSNPFRLDRNMYGGGIMMYFKDNINIVPCKNRPTSRRNGSNVV